MTLGSRLKQLLQKILADVTVDVVLASIVAFNVSTFTWRVCFMIFSVSTPADQTSVSLETVDLTDGADLAYKANIVQEAIVT